MLSHKLDSLLVAAVQDGAGSAAKGFHLRGPVTTTAADRSVGHVLTGGGLVGSRLRVNGSAAAGEAFGLSERDYNSALLAESLSPSADIRAAAETVLTSAAAAVAMIHADVATAATDAELCAAVVQAADTVTTLLDSVRGIAERHAGATSASTAGFAAAVSGAGALLAAMAQHNVAPESLVVDSGAAAAVPRAPAATARRGRGGGAAGKRAVILRGKTPSRRKGTGKGAAR
jgi:hypothetical protein